MKGTITDLTIFAANTFEAVLCLGGPLSLVYGKRSKQKAMVALTMTAKDGTAVFISVMNRDGGIALLLNMSPDEIRTNNFINLAIRGEDRTWVAVIIVIIFHRRS